MIVQLVAWAGAGGWKDVLHTLCAEMRWVGTIAAGYLVL